MTICVAVKVHDCLIFATDSATSLISTNSDGVSSISNIYNNGNKVFNLVANLPVVAMTAGMGNIGAASIASLAKDLRSKFKNGDPDFVIDADEYTIEEIAIKARQFLFENCYETLPEGKKPVGDHSLEFWVGGYGATNDHAELWKITILNGKCAPPSKIFGEDQCSVAWGGQPEAINRLLLGYGQQLAPTLIKAGALPEEMPGLIGQITKTLGRNFASGPMPIQDAIELADFLVYVTKMFVRFDVGGDTVGGHADIASVTKHEGFKWIRRKHFYPESLNRETDHV